MTRKTISMLVLLSVTTARTAIYFNNAANNTTVNKGVFEVPVIEKINHDISDKVNKSLPKVHAGLLLGMTIGLEDIKKSTVFYDKLIQTSLVHVVVVSGYNVALVMKFVSRLFIKKTDNKNKMFLLIFIVIYALICGLQPPVIRASAMGYISYLAMTEGRGLDGLRLLTVVALLMVLIFPPYLISLSFWLSTTATLGLIFFEPAVSSFLDKIPGKQFWRRFLPVDDLATTLSCQILVWPVVSYFFGRVSLISPLYNMAVLWLIPYCTVAGFILIFISCLLPFMAGITALIIFPFYDLFVRAINLFAELDRGNLTFRLSFIQFLFYYTMIGGAAWHLRRQR